MVCGVFRTVRGAFTAATGRGVTSALCALKRGVAAGRAAAVLSRLVAGVAVLSGWVKGLIDTLCNIARRSVRDAAQQPNLVAYSALNGAKDLLASCFFAVTLRALERSRLRSSSPL